MANSMTSGSVKITHSSMVVFWKPGLDGSVSFLAFLYTRKKNGQPWTTWRFPNETEDEELAKAGKRETPFDTAVSCVQQEVTSDPGQFVFIIENSDRPIFMKKCDGDPDKGGGIIEKYLFLARIKRGELRAVNFEEPAKTDSKTGAVHPGEILGPPTWFEAERLAGMMHERGIRFHQEALVKALEFLAADKAVGVHYSRFLASRCESE